MQAVICSDERDNATTRRPKYVADQDGRTLPTTTTISLTQLHVVNRWCYFVEAFAAWRTSDLGGFHKDPEVWWSSTKTDSCTPNGKGTVCFHFPFSLWLGSNNWEVTGLERRPILSSSPGGRPEGKQLSLPSWNSTKCLFFRLHHFMKLFPIVSPGVMTL